VKDPHALWNIETPTRAIKERENARKTNAEVKGILDGQVMAIVQGRQMSRENDMSEGLKAIEKDATSNTH
jgi:hypothetical protein